MNRRNLVLLLVLSASWGPSFLFIKVAVAEIAPATIVFGRVLIGALLLLLIIRLQGGSLPRNRQTWKHLAFLGLMQNALPFALFAWGEQYIESALASILNGVTPIFTIVLAHYLVATDKLTAAKLTGTLLGFVGLAFLIGPALLEGFQATTLGSLAVVVASICYAVAIVYARRNVRGGASKSMAAGQLLFAALYALPFMLILDQPLSGPLPSALSLAALFALGAIGTGFAFYIYYMLLETAEPSFVSMVTYIVPVFGVLLGIFVLDEQLTWNVFAGFGLILFGVAVVNGLFQRRGAVPAGEVVEPSPYE